MLTNDNKFPLHLYVPVAPAPVLVINLIPGDVESDEIVA